MKVGRFAFYLVLAFTLVLAYSLWVGPLWAVDAVVFTVLALAIGYFSFKDKADTTMVDVGLQERLGSAPRSRIAHYARLARIKSTDYAAQESHSSFERALLGQSEWKVLSEERLTEIAHRPPDKTPGQRSRETK